MNTQAIERINGYCCEVTQEQWEELVKVADGTGIEALITGWQFGSKKAFVHCAGTTMLKDGSNVSQKPVIPLPDFLAKLRGDQEWTPKAGEMVEVSGDDGRWYLAEYIGFSKNRHVVLTGGWTGAVVTDWPNCRPLRPTITRAEA
jgi:hypothetical protein